MDDDYFDPHTFAADWSYIEFDSSYPVPCPDLETKQLADFALEALTPSEREVVELLYGFRGDIKNDAEVAAIRRTSKRTVKEQRQSALLKMRRRLGLDEDGNLYEQPAEEAHAL